MKSISPPDLTAYALNELPPDAAAELTLLLAVSPAEAATAADTRAFCELLSTTLATPDVNQAGELSVEQKQTIAENLPPTNVVHKFRWPIWAGAGAAAAVAAWLVWPYALGKRSDVAAESSAASKVFLPGGGGGEKERDMSIVASTPVDSPTTASGEALARTAPPLPKLALGAVADPSAATSDRKAPESALRTDLYAAAPKADGTNPPPANAPMVASNNASGRGTPLTGKPADASGADPEARYKLSLTDGPERRQEEKLSQSLYAIDESAPRSGQPAELMDAIQTAPQIATATHPSAPIAAPAPATISGAGKLGTVAQNRPMAKHMDAEGDSQHAADGLRRSGNGVLLLETDATRTKEAAKSSKDAAKSSDRLYMETEEGRSLVTRPALQPAQPSSESYIAPPENPFKQVAAEPLSTFSIDVDTASYANVRRFLNMGQRPPAEAVRVEELVNYFRYAYPAPEAGKPSSLTADLVVCPWNEHHRLARVALKARVDENRPKANLVFLLDVSGSMNEPNKLPLVKQSLKLLVDKLSENDRVSIVVYAGASGVVLPPTHGENKKAILGAIDNLQPGGSTNGASGITLAYEMARKEFLKEGVNRVILATDGDFNVGISDRNGLQSLIEKEAKSGVFLSVLGYGMGNLKDSTMETLADKGNGNYAYIDSLGEARKVLSEEMSSTLVTVAKDVKIQIEFNPGKVRAYKLLGYENRMLAKEDFNDDKKDAGEMGAGHTVTALYEITPIDAPADVPPVDPLKYQPVTKAEDKAAARPDSPEIMTVKLRYKAPDADVSQLMELPVMDKNAAVASAPGDFQFATAVAGYGLLLRGSKQVGSLNWDMIRSMAKAGKGEDPEGYRGEFLQLIDKAASAVPLP